MAFTITSQPAALNFVGNLQDFILNTDADIAFKLYQGDDLIIEEQYWPDSSGKIDVDLEDLIDGLLSLAVPDQGVSLYDQAAAYAQFKAVFDETEVLFTVVKGGVDGAIVPADFLAANFLTWQPQIKAVGLEEPQWLSYYASEECVMKAKGYLPNSTTMTVEVATLPAGKLSTVNVTFSEIADLFALQPDVLDLWIEKDAEALTWKQRLHLTDEVFEFSDLFIFSNSIGGIDTIKFTGTREISDAFTLSSALFDDITREYQVDPNQVFTKDTGFFRSDSERQWSLEFFKSLMKYHYSGGLMKDVITPKQTLDSSQGDLNGYSFTFALGKQTKYTNLPRNPLPVIINEKRMIYYGPAETSVMAESDVLLLPFSVSSDDNLEFETGHNRIFAIALPPEYLLDQVIDNDSNESLTARFILKQIFVKEVAYNVYQLQNAVPYYVSRLFSIKIKNSYYVAPVSYIYYGASSAVPTTASAIKLLNKLVGNSEFDLQTGQNRIFTIALPPGMVLFRVYDPNSEENLTDMFVNTDIAIDGMKYSVHNMQLPIAYSQNHIYTVKIA